MIETTASKIEQVTRTLRALIDEESFEGGALPSEPELARRLGVSRATVRQALTILTMDGIVVRKHGVGTFVNQHIQSIGTRLEEVWNFEEMIRLSGHVPGVHHLALSLGPASSEVGEKLALAPGSEVLTTANVFLADDVRVIYCVDVIPAGLVNQAYRNEELHGPVYRFLAKRCQQWVDYNIAELSPVVAGRLSTLLDCSPTSPLLRFETVGFNADNVPIIHSESYYRPEYFSFHVVRKMRTAQSRRQTDA